MGLAWLEVMRRAVTWSPGFPAAAMVRTSDPSPLEPDKWYHELQQEPQVLRSWTNHWITLHLSFLLYKMGTIICAFKCILWTSKRFSLRTCNKLEKKKKLIPLVTIGQSRWCEVGITVLESASLPSVSPPFLQTLSSSSPRAHVHPQLPWLRTRRAGLHFWAASRGWHSMISWFLGMLGLLGWGGCFL